MLIILLNKALVNKTIILLRSIFILQNPVAFAKQKPHNRAALNMLL
jgi:hypothetical protein